MRERAFGLAVWGVLALVLGMGCGGGTSDPVTRVLSIEPAAGGIEGGTLITVTGVGLASAETVTFAWERATDLDVAGGSSLTCVTPPGSAGVCDVAVMLAGGAIVLTESFTYMPPEPTLTIVTPNVGPPNVGTLITLRGTGFLHGPVTVTLGGENCGNVSAASDTVVTCTVPAPGTGTDLPITVTTAGGSATLPDAFSYVPYAHDGEYFFVEFQGLSTGGSPAHEGRTRWGTLVTDGSGEYTGGEVWENHDGAISGPSAPSERPYFIDAKRGFYTGSMDDPVMVGRISEDDGLVVLGTVRPGVPAATRILGRVEDGHDDSSLIGTYHFATVFEFGSNRSTLWGTAVFDGSGGAVGDYDSNQDGFVFGPNPDTLSYSVTTPQGRVDLIQGGAGFDGQILQGGDVLIAAGSTYSGFAPVVLVFVRGNGVAGPETLTGNYAFAAMSRGNPAWDAYTGELVSNGDGTGTVTDFLGHDGDTTWTDWPQAPYGFDYTINTTTEVGLLEAFVDESVVSGGHLDGYGGVTPDGVFAFHGGSQMNGEHPMLWFLLR